MKGKALGTIILLAYLAIVLAACAPATPVIIEKEVVVEKPVVQTVVIEKVVTVEKPVTVVVEKEIVVEKPVKTLVEIEKEVIKPIKCGDFLITGFYLSYLYLPGGAQHFWGSIKNTGEAATVCVCLFVNGSKVDEATVELAAADWVNFPFSNYKWLPSEECLDRTTVQVCIDQCCYQEQWPCPE